VGKEGRASPDVYQLLQGAREACVFAHLASDLGTPNIPAHPPLSLNIAALSTCQLKLTNCPSQHGLLGRSHLSRTRWDGIPLCIRVSEAARPKIRLGYNSLRNPRTTNMASLLIFTEFLLRGMADLVVLLPCMVLKPAGPESSLSKIARCCGDDSCLARLIISHLFSRRMISSFVFRFPCCLSMCNHSV